VAILRSDHDYLADAVGGTDKPLYEIIHAKLMTEVQLKEYESSLQNNKEIFQENENLNKNSFIYVQIKSLVI
jgi:hypothetical protein